MSELNEFAIVANVVETDKIFRTGAKVTVQWLCHDGSLYCKGLSRSGRVVTKWVPLTRLDNFRPAWCAPRSRSQTVTYTRTNALEESLHFQRYAVNERLAHPNRRGVNQ